MNTASGNSGGVLSVVVDEALRRDVDRVAAAAGVRVVHVGEPSSSKVWTAASAVVLDVDGARRCAQLALPRRGRVLVVGHAEPRGDDWKHAMSVGAHRVLLIPSRKPT